MAATRDAVPVSPHRTKVPEALFDKLSPGPGMPASEVASHQRARLLGAIARIVDDRGYRAVTVRELSSLAGVSTRTFYAHFRDKDDCIRGACEAFERKTIRLVAATRAEADEEDERLRLGFVALADQVCAEPLAARLTLLAAPSLGLDPASTGVGGVDPIFEALLTGSEDLSAAPFLLREGIMAGIARVVRSRLLAGTEHELGDLGVEVARWIRAFRVEETVEAIARLDFRPLPPVDAAQESSWRPGGEGSARENDRSLILVATLKLALTNGCEHLTVPRIRSAAGVSRRAFDANFDGAGDCFLAALELRASHLLVQAASQAGDAGWPAGVCRAVAALTSRIARDPAFARLALVDALRAGVDGLRCQESIIGASGSFVRNQAPADSRPSELAAEASIAALWRIMQCYVDKGRARDLRRANPTLALLILAPGLAGG